MGGSGKGKGSSRSSTTVVKPWAKTESPRRSFNSGAAVAPWTKSSKTSSESRGWSERSERSESRKGGKSKGKGKRRFKGAAPKKSEFWVRKMEEENRSVIDTAPLTGVVCNYNWKQGFGFILPDSPDDLPEEIKDELRKANKARREPREKGYENILYFRKPDVETNFRIKKDSEVTFGVYMDDKGCGACDVCDPNGTIEVDEDAAAEDA